MIVKGDIVLAISNSGETDELLRLAEALKRLGIFLISLVGNPNASLARASDIVLDVSIRREACPLGLAPTASTTAALAMGDALAIALSEKRGFKAEDFAHLHPGGKLGKRFQRVENLMHSGNQVPVVSTETPMHLLPLTTPSSHAAGTPPVRPSCGRPRSAGLGPIPPSPR